MNKRRVVVGLGRVAFGSTLPQQKEAVQRAARAIADLVEARYQVVVTHSNGLQIGMIHAAMNEFSKNNQEFTAAPVAVCGALSQGYIGYDLQNALRTELLDRGIYKPVCTIITQVRVDPFDKAFNHPTKEIGRILTKEEADAEVEKGNYVTEVDGGYRRIVAAPQPIDIYEIDSIRTLADADQVVIACGGGGIPVMQQGTRLRGASAIIEKDLGAARLAQMLDADDLLFLTGTEQMTVKPGTSQKQKLGKLTTVKAEELIEEGYFDAISTLPKMQAAVEFVSSGKDRRAIITSLDKALAGLKEKAGTIIS